MNRAALEHILRAAAAIADERDFVVIGSQAVLGQFPHAPDALLVSIEADIYPRQAPVKSDLIDGAIGELSMFHQTFGYYAHGVDETIATLPACETLPARDFRKFCEVLLRCAWPQDRCAASAHRSTSSSCSSSRPIGQ
jgi:hypothetical protein